jgi:diadenosine tetraphosphate (Ap4A) HIT family hydrolase
MSREELLAELRPMYAQSGQEMQASAVSEINAALAEQNATLRAKVEEIAGSLEEWRAVFRELKKAHDGERAAREAAEKERDALRAELEQESQRHGATLDAIQNDVAALLRAAGLFDGAQDASPHELVVSKIVPTITKLRAERDELARKLEETTRRHVERVNEAYGNGQETALQDAVREAGGDPSEIISENFEFIRRLAARVAKLEGLLGRAVKYAREDRMRTPGTTRLARLLEEASAALSEARGGEQRACFDGVGACTRGCMIAEQEMLLRDDGSLVKP